MNHDGIISLVDPTPAVLGLMDFLFSTFPLFIVFIVLFLRITSY